MNIYEELELHDCPYCGGAGVLEEENGWCWYAVCMDCGAQTAHFEYRDEQQRLQAARSAADLWNFGKIIRPNGGD